MCRAEAPHLETLYQKYKDEGLHVIGVGFDWGWPYYCDDWATTFGLTFPIVNDENYTIAEELGVPSVPFTVIIDGDNVVQYTGRTIDELQVSTLIEDLLENITALDTTESRQPAPVIVPARLHLETPYPNPFNPTTTISYTLDSRAKVKVEVFDLRGQLIAILADGYKAAGSHKLVWNAQNQASGAYIIQVSSPVNSENVTVLLMK